MERKNRLENEVKSWLKIVLKNENLRNLCVNIAGNTEKGDGFSGDILFVDAYATAVNNDIRKYNFVLKCSKNSEALRASVSLEKVYINEICIYEKMVPVFNQLQLEKGIDNMFDSMPKCYGTIRNPDREIIVFENLKKNGYILWDKKKPLTRNHIEMVVGEYGKWHAISVAMKAQQPEKFQEVSEFLENTWGLLIKESKMIPVFEKFIVDVYDLLKNELDNNVLTKWKELEQQVDYILNRMLQYNNGLKVIIHGDCWNNNFLFKHSDKDLKIPVKVAVLDWQLSNLKSPIADLSHYIFATISGDDLNDLEEILQCYYNSFSSFLVNLGSDPQKLYPFNQFLKDWKQFCRYGIAMASMIIKMCCSDKDEVFDLDEGIESGKDISEIFGFDIRNKEMWKDRIKPIVKYVVEHELI